MLVGGTPFHLREYDDDCLVGQKTEKGKPDPDPDRVRLFGTTLGAAAPAVLLVHCWGGDGREWSPHAEALAGHFRVIVPDRAGTAARTGRPRAAHPPRGRPTWPRSSTPSTAGR